jgi:16S rRNA G966 N2-methylase RsmD
MITQEEILFMEKNKDKDPYQISLRAKQNPSINLPKIASQIQARQKLNLKLPTWTANPQIFYPKNISLEQSSSEITAHFKASLVSGNVVDLTGGMGVDTAAFSENASKVTYIELQKDLCDIAKYNHDILGFSNILHINTDGLTFLKLNNEPLDFIYVDPARRDEKGNKVILFKDCQPNVLDILKIKSDDTALLIKTSPLLDLERAILELKGVDKVWVVCVKNEVKEILFLKHNQVTLNPLIEVIELNKKNSLLYSSKLSDEKAKISTLGPISNFLYEPHPGMLKAGFFKSVETENVIKLNSNTHLYTSSTRDIHFPGKSFRVIETGPVDVSWLSKHLPNQQVNISTRNFPGKPDDLRKKLKLKEGGEFTLFGYRNHRNEVELALTQKCNI